MNVNALARLVSAMSLAMTASCATQEVRPIPPHAVSIEVSQPLTVEPYRARFRTTIRNQTDEPVCFDMPAGDLAAVGYRLPGEVVGPLDLPAFQPKLQDAWAGVLLQRVEVPLRGNTSVEGYTPDIRDFLIREDDGSLREYRPGEPIAVIAGPMFYPCVLTSSAEAGSAGVLTRVWSPISEPFVLGP